MVTLLPNSDPAFPPVSDGEYTRGPANATITFLEYADFQCPYCAQLEAYLKDVLAANPDDVRLVYRYFPLTGHALGLIAAQSAEAAANQGKFWEMHDALFARQDEWSTMAETDFIAWATDEAKTLGLDTAKFASDLKDPAVVQKVAAAQTSAEAIGIPGTPFLLANGNSIGSQVAIANMGQNTSGSQFFITYGAQPTLDGNYTIIGQVIQGMDVVKNLTARNPANPGTLPDPDKIVKVTIEVK